MFDNLELHAAAIVAIPALIILARQLAAVLPGKRALYANIAAQLLVAAGIAIGMGGEELGVGELAAGAGLFAGVNVALSTLGIEGIKRTAAGNKLVKGKTGTGDGRT